MCDSAKTNDEEDKEMELKLKKYEILYTAYADEIRNLWTRSVFLGAFMVLVWGGYGALQLKFITRKCGEFDITTYYIVSLGLCAVIIILSLLWIAMAKGSKFVQEAHEAHIAKYNELDFLFCSLDDYQKCCYDTDKLQYVEHSTTKPLNSYRYSPSKINIALGVFSAIVAVILGAIHAIMSKNCYAIILIILLLVAFIYLMKYLKGGKISKKGVKNG